MDDATASTAAPNVVGEARNLDELLEVLRRRIFELGVSRECVDHVAGLPPRYCAKIFGPLKRKKLGKVSLGLLLGALGLKLTIVEDSAAFQKVKRRLARKHAGKRMLAKRRERRGAQWAKNPAMAQLTRRVQALSQSPAARRAIALEAARARWGKSANGATQATPAPAG